MTTAVRYTVEIQNHDGEWHPAQALDADDPVEAGKLLDYVLQVIRQSSLTRYRRARIMKTVTTTEQVGEEVTI